LPDLYKSKTWLKLRYCKDKMHPEAIARLCGVNEKTIRRYIEKFELKR
jgi:DeoR/GlpR family transcriptional regulator of sugar metabolism